MGQALVMARIGKVAFDRSANARQNFQSFVLEHFFSPYVKESRSLISPGLLSSSRFLANLGYEPENTILAGTMTGPTTGPLMLGRRG